MCVYMYMYPVFHIWILKQTLASHVHVHVHVHEDLDYMYLTIWESYDNIVG